MVSGWALIAALHGRRGIVLCSSTNQHDKTHTTEQWARLATANSSHQSPSGIYVSYDRPGIARFANRHL